MVVKKAELKYIKTVEKNSCMFLMILRVNTEAILGFSVDKIPVKDNINQKIC